MKIKDCKVGGKCLFKNRKWKITLIDGLNLNLERKNEAGIYQAYVSCEKVKPVNKFEVGKTAITYKGEKVRLWGKRYSDEIGMYRYSTITEYDKDVFYWEDELRISKKKDELEVGDKFKINKTIFEVLAVAEDEYRNCKSYFSKILNGSHKGKILARLSIEIHEIIYD